MVSRRVALKMIAGSAGSACSFSILGNVQPLARADALPHAETFRPKFFSTQEIQTLAALSETVIPADENSPGAMEARVGEYIDDIVAASDETTRSFWKAGVAAIDHLARTEYGKGFAECTAEQKIALLEKISMNEEHPVQLEERFFVAVKRATIDGYYTSAIGIHQDLEYQGNTALPEFPGCAHGASHS